MKKVIFKIVAVLTVFVIMLSMITINAFALSGSTAITVSSANPKVGATLIVTASFELDGEAQALGEMHFDSTKLKYISSSPAGDTNFSNGVVYFVADDFVTSHYFRVEFEVLAEGETTISLSECVISDGTSEVTLSGASKTVKAGTQQSSTSSQDPTQNAGAALTSITVASGTLSPEFKESVTDYMVIVPYTQTDGIVSCTTRDEDAKVTVQGNRELKVGLNKRTIIVTASNGEERRYTVTFNRLDENGRDTTISDEELIKATVNGKEFVVTQANENYTVPTGFTLTTATYNDQEIAVYADASGKMNIVYLRAADNSQEGFYIFENNEFKTFNFIEFGDKLYIVSEPTQTFDKLFKSDFEKDGRKIPCYKYMVSELADFIVFLGRTADGQETYYRYDTLEGTIQRFPDILSSEKTEETGNEITVPATKKIVVIALAGVLVLGIIAILVLTIVKIALSTRNKNEEILADDTDIE